MWKNRRICIKVRSSSLKKAWLYTEILSAPGNHLNSLQLLALHKPTLTLDMSHKHNGDSGATPIHMLHIPTNKETSKLRKRIRKRKRSLQLIRKNSHRQTSTHTMHISNTGLLHWISRIMSRSTFPPITLEAAGNMKNLMKRRRMKKKLRKNQKNWSRSFN